MTIDAEKDVMRERARLRRRDLANAAGVGFGNKLAAHFSAHFPIEKSSKVAGYWAITREADTKPLLYQLHQEGVNCLLPVVIARDTALLFREWQPGDALKPSDLAIPEPGRDRAAGVPDTILVPLLAFDKDGYRLGYGGGYYDRTLLELRAERDITAIGVAYAGQEVDSVPRESFDQPIDGVLTEHGLTMFKQKAG